MSKITEKWKSCIGPMSREEISDRLSEFENINLDDFYTNGKRDYDKATSKGLTHLIKSVVVKNGEVIDFRIYNDFSGYVYLITSDIGLTKIGRTEDIEKRFSQVDNASPCGVRLYHCQFVKDSVKLEQLLHKQFSLKRIKGEWFNLDKDDLSIAREILDTFTWKSNLRKS